MVLAGTLCVIVAPYAARFAYVLQDDNQENEVI
jgi:hypothetical protein